MKKILVAYASKYGATRAIAERLAQQLRAEGHEAQAQPVLAAASVAGFDACVVGSAAYMGHWQKDAVEFVRRNASALADQSTWLFSSGPLGRNPIDEHGAGPLIAAEPKEIPELLALVHARHHRVFFGALDPGRLGIRDRAIRALPAGRALLPEGDFREWDEIDAWAGSIARELTSAVTASP